MVMNRNPVDPKSMAGTPINDQQHLKVNLYSASDVELITWYRVSDTEINKEKERVRVREVSFQAR